MVWQILLVAVVGFVALLTVALCKAAAYGDRHRARYGARVGAAVSRSESADDPGYQCE